jgi:Flp pilus assembly protein TadG
MRYTMNIRRRNENGATLLLVAAGLVFMLGMCALAIDLVTGYLARVQCQRAADAAALAGAKVLANSCATTTGGCSMGGAQEALATQSAVAIAGENPVMGLAPTSATMCPPTCTSPVTGFTYPNSTEPQITVTIYRDSSHQDALPTLFAKIFGIDTMNISASATAEAYNPAGNNQQITVGCIKPFLVPNCDPNFPVLNGDPRGNPNCACGGQGVTQGDCPATFNSNYVMSYYVYPPTAAAAVAGTVVNPGDYVAGGCSTPSSCTGGIRGAPWVLHNNLNNPVPSQWYTIAFSTQSGKAYENYIQQCAPQSIACTTYLGTLNGKKVGPTDQGVNDLIGANNDGFQQGQDYLCSPYSWPGAPSGCDTSMPTSGFTIIPGANNPYGYKSATSYSTLSGQSNGITTIVLYDGTQLSPGGSTTQVQGYMQLFIQAADHKSNTDNVYGTVMSVSGCGGGVSVGGGNPPPVTSTGGSYIPIRLIQQPGN